MSSSTYRNDLIAAETHMREAYVKMPPGPDKNKLQNLMAKLQDLINSLPIP